jgi:PAS domain S-box-containing protein
LPQRQRYLCRSSNARRKRPTPELLTVSDEQRASGTVDEREEVLRLFIDGLTEHAFVTLAPDGIITSWNVGAQHLFGHRRERTVGVHVSKIFKPEDHESGVRMEDLQRAERLGSVSGSRWVAHADGSRRYVRATIVALRRDVRCVGYAALAQEAPVPMATDEDGRSMRNILMARVEDTTRRLSESNALLATEIADRTQAEAARIRLLRRLVVAQEEERRRIARDLHDDLGQRLTALRLTLEAGVKERREPPAITRALQMLARIDQSVDFLAWELRPAALDELGLDKVLETFVAEWSRHTGIRATFHAASRDVERFVPELEASIYRIAQEALNNVAKHAHARSVNVLLEQRGETIVLVVEDDGAGFQPTGTGETMIGLMGMRERAAAVGGTTEIEPTPDGGTTVLTRMPLCPLHVEHSRRAFDSRVVTALGSPSASAVGASDSSPPLSSIRVRVQELQQAVAARDEFIATVAHELRNPIAPLTFQLRLAIEKSERLAAAGESMPVEWVQSQLRRIEQRLHRLLETLDRLLDVSRLSTGRIDLQPEPTDLAQAVREVITSLEAELAVARCKLTLSERGEATGAWDRLRLEQICRNLLSNAIRFGAGRPIEVMVDADDDFATLQVRDHGVGIDANHQTRIFERFERGMEQRSGGFGIGLWVVKTICVAMGGTVAVESEPGEGARFTVMLPRFNERESVTVGPEGT